MNSKKVAGQVLQFVLGLAILLAGWGFDDLSGFFAHLARAGFVAVVLATMVWIFAWRLDLQPFRRGQVPVGWQRVGLVLLMVTALSLIFFLAYADRRSLLTFAGAEFLRYLGLGLYAGGNVISLYALRALGKQYSGYVTLQNDHQLVDTGIYAVIRHPIYLRALMVFVGLPLLFRSWLVLPVLPLGAWFVSYRIRREEKLLAETFGEQYRAYSGRTRRLLPYLY